LNIKLTEFYIKQQACKSPLNSCRPGLEKKKEKNSEIEMVLIVWYKYIYKT